MFEIEKYGDFFLEEIEDDFDLGDFILFRQGELVFELAKMFGSKSIKIEIDGYSATVDSPDVDPCEKFEDRLSMVLISSRKISEQSGIGYDKICGVFLVLDGWTWSDHSFRSPVWMNDFREIDIGDAKKIKGLEWLSNSSSEIEYKHVMGQES